MRPTRIGKASRSSIPARHSPAATGGHAMVYEYDFATGQFSGPIFSAPAAGLPRKVTGLQY